MLIADDVGVAHLLVYLNVLAPEAAWMKQDPRNAVRYSLSKSIRPHIFVAFIRYSIHLPVRNIVSAAGKKPMCPFDGLTNLFDQQKHNPGSKSQVILLDAPCQVLRT